MSDLASWPSLGHNGQHAAQKGAGGWTGTLVKTLALLVCAAVEQKAGRGGV